MNSDPRPRERRFWAADVEKDVDDEIVFYVLRLSIHAFSRSFGQQLTTRSAGTRARRACAIA
ncbi:MAG: hypothetical protein A3H96_21935 [Acidobacteria bacterium RIFCSPLOWO2_02_FULL_67_36]|nr:MAG: hypothetical protein A3H96_21935 [Acidobacteria bacterium RIFCSPLOWO2_02_FULL_67_36]OFW19855.1 MAG: hypothetical protein A3G21_09530 [Acidobacteria bacterium RIFCSPLOWO2_12_FULL_66_21]